MVLRSGAHITQTTRLLLSMILVLQRRTPSNDTWYKLVSWPTLIFSFDNGCNLPYLQCNGTVHLVFPVCWSQLTFLSVRFL